MTKKQRGALCVEALEKEYPDALCSLDYKDPLQLIIAVRLSAQCTDERVNKVTPALFKKYPDLESFCNADVADIAPLRHRKMLLKEVRKTVHKVMIPGGQIPGASLRGIHLGIGLQKKIFLILRNIPGATSVPDTVECIDGNTVKRCQLR